MAEKYNSITVLDLELACWEDGNTEKSDIIEIGVALLDVKKEQVVKSHSIYVRPREKISEYCTDLTGITQRMIDKQGKTLQKAIEQLARHYPTAKTVATWGDGDLRVIKEQCELYGVEYPYDNASHLNVANMYHLEYKEKRKIKLEEALKKLGLEFLGRPHCGKDDAVNTAYLLAKLLWNSEGL